MNAVTIYILSTGTLGFAALVRTLALIARSS